MSLYGTLKGIEHKKNELEFFNTDFGKKIKTLIISDNFSNNIKFRLLSILNSAFRQKTKEELLEIKDFINKNKTEYSETFKYFTSIIKEITGKIDFIIKFELFKLTKEEQEERNKIIQTEATKFYNNHYNEITKLLKEKENIPNFIRKKEEKLKKIESEIDGLSDLLSYLNKGRNIFGIEKLIEKFGNNFDELLKLYNEKKGEINKLTNEINNLKIKLNSLSRLNLSSPNRILSNHYFYNDNGYFEEWKKNM